LLAATLYQGNPDRSNKLWNIVSTERYEREYVESFIELFYLCITIGDSFIYM